jgi:hypothetical protein
MIIMLSKKKVLKLSLCAGNTKSYCCPDKNYIFTLQVLRRKETRTSKTRKSNVSHIVPGHYYVSKFVPHSACCLSECKTCEDEIALMTFIWGNDSSGDQKPLFGINSTNGIEGENNAYLHNNIHHKIVLNGAIAFMLRCTLVRTKLMEKYKNYISTNATVTQKALEHK